jgi:hypothetical protein
MQTSTSSPKLLLNLFTTRMLGRTPYATNTFTFGHEHDEQPSTLSIRRLQLLESHVDPQAYVYYESGLILDAH